MKPIKIKVINGVAEGGILCPGIPDGEHEAFLKWQYGHRGKWYDANVDEMTDDVNFETRQIWVLASPEMKEEILWAKGGHCVGVNGIVYPMALYIKNQKGLKKDIVDLCLNLAAPDDDCMLSDFLHALQFVLDKHNI